MQIRVYYEDTDLGGFVYYANYLKFCERARSELFFAIGMSPCRDDYHFVVKNLKAEYIKPAKFADLLEVSAELVALKSASVQMKQVIQKEGETIFAMEVELVCLKGEKIARIPEDYKAIFTRLKP